MSSPPPPPHQPPASSASAGAAPSVLEVELKTDANGVPEPVVVESACMSCGDSGETTILPYEIPFFRQIALVSFRCEHCGYQNNEIMMTGAVRDYGVRYTLSLDGLRDLSREIVKGEFAEVSVPEIELSIPPQTQKASLNTVEGILTRFVESMESDQAERQEKVPELYEQIEAYLVRVRALLSGTVPFTLVVDDPSGNSFVQSLTAPKADPKLAVERYRRTEAHCEQLAIKYEPEMSAPVADALGDDDDGTAAQRAALKKDTYKVDDTFYERLVDDTHSIMVFPGRCLMCESAGKTSMFQVDIPFFKQTVLMTFLCDSCGYRNIEIKAGGGIAPKGRRYELTCRGRDDFGRSVIKSDTASVHIPEADLTIEQGTLGGVVTTVEGMLTMAYEHLRDSSFLVGDSALSVEREAFDTFLRKCETLLEGNTNFTFIIDDPVANSYVAAETEHPENDKFLKVVDYERTTEQDEELGLLDMNVGDDQDQASAAAASAADAAPSGSA